MSRRPGETNGAGGNDRDAPPVKVMVVISPGQYAEGLVANLHIP